jgi:hypothetical protein
VWVPSLTLHQRTTNNLRDDAFSVGAKHRVGGGLLLLFEYASDAPEQPEADLAVAEQAPAE